MITINNLTKKYNTTPILKNMSYQFQNTGITCILGASGSGKTTLLNLLAGFDTDYSGEITVCGKNITAMNPGQLCEYRKNYIGFIFQNYNLISGYNVWENIMLAAELNDKSPEENEKNALELIAKLGIDTKTDARVENLSGGQKQRVAIARALINEPRILFADEPTGALDRETSSQIMDLLKEIAKDRLVVIITHDKKICDWADEVISIVDEKIEVIAQAMKNADSKVCESKQSNKQNISIFKRALRNFKNHLGRYIAVSMAVAIGVSAFALSLSSQNIIGQSIEQFKEHNTAFNNGYVRIEAGKDPYHLLKNDKRTQNLYYQYVLNDVVLSRSSQNIEFKKKLPMPKATQNMSFGIMPRAGKNEIALTPSIAGKLKQNAKELLGEKITLKYGGQQKELTISGVYNAMYDDFLISSDIEQALYEAKRQEKPFSLSYDVKDFSDVAHVAGLLKDKGILAETAAEQVTALEKTFNSLKTLFLILSLLILTIGLFICIMLLTKLTTARYREIGLLSALGYSRRQIRNILTAENLLLAGCAAVFNIVILGVAVTGTQIFFSSSILIQPLQIGLSILSTFVTVALISNIASAKLIRTEPAEALRHTFS